MMLRRALLAGGGAAAFLVAVVAPHTVGAAESTGVVTLVHGVRGLVADIYLDGSPVLQVFEPERITDPITLPVGAHQVQVRPTGASATSAPLLDTTFIVSAGVRQSAVVHLDSAGQPSLTVFADDPIPVPLGRARVLVRHTAAAPTFAVSIDGGAAMSGVANGGQIAQDLAAGTHVVAVTAAATALLPPREVDFAEGTSTALYLVGSATGADLMWLAEDLPAAATAPAAVRSGNSPVPGTSGASTTTTLWIVAIGVAMFAVAAGLFRHRGREGRVSSGAAAGFAGLAIGVTSLAVVARSSLNGSGRPALTEPATALTFAKVAGAPHAKSSAGALTVAIGSRPAALDSVVRTAVARPVMVAIQPGDLVAQVDARGAEPRTGDMDIPTDPKLVGWYEHGPVPGEPGSAVIAGHVAFDGQAGSFARLAAVEAGAVILVTYEDSTVRAFRVTDRRAYVKAKLPTEDLFRRTGPATLSLVTCGGTFDERTRSYADNIVVSAVPL